MMCSSQISQKSNTQGTLFSWRRFENIHAAAWTKINMSSAAKSNALQPKSRSEKNKNDKCEEEKTSSWNFQLYEYI